MAKIHIDQGHGYPDNRGGVLGLNEGENNYHLSNEIGKALENVGHDVTYSRSKITDDPLLPKRNEFGAGKDLFLSVHSNAGGGTGVEIYDRNGSPSPTMAHRLSETIARTLEIDNRGVKYRYRNGTFSKVQNSSKGDYFGVLRNNKAKRAYLVEFFFHDNPRDVRAYRARKDKMIKEVVQVINGFLGGVELATPTKSTPILAEPSVTAAQMKAWAKSKKAHETFIRLIPTFYNVAVTRGIDPAVIYAQSAKETGYMKFGGVLDESFHNPCGLKTTQGGGDKDAGAHKRFPDWRTGIEAQADHLALYAGATGYPKSSTPDPRHFPSLHGTATTVEDLGGRWAPSIRYGKEIVEMIAEMRQMAGGKIAEKGARMIIVYMPDAKLTAEELSEKISAPILSAYTAHDYRGKYSRVICIGGQPANFTQHMTHWIDLKDNHNRERIDDKIQEFMEFPVRFKKERKA